MKISYVKYTTKIKLGKTKKLFYFIIFFALMFFSMGLLASILIGVGLSLRYKYNLDREKIRPFECGFTPKFSARLPFSIRFFMVAIIFLVFDVELILIFPAVPALINTHTMSIFAGLFFIILFLILGLFHEIFEGSLSWAR